jgi:hypothetical protein
VSYRGPPVYVDNLLAMCGLCALGVLLVHSLGASDLSFRHYLEHRWEFGATLRGLVAGLTPTTGKNFVSVLLRAQRLPYGEDLLHGPLHA